MRPVTRVSLNGRALQLEDDAHALLSQYLESAARALDANPDRAEILADLEHEKILGGVPLKLFFKDQPNDFLIAVTELNTREQLDALAAALSAAISRERR